MTTERMTKIRELLKSSLFIANKFAESRRTDLENIKEQGLRCYKWSPDRALIQIRTKSQKVGYIASLTLNATECRQLADHLTKLAAELE